MKESGRHGDRRSLSWAALAVLVAVIGLATGGALFGQTHHETTTKVMSPGDELASKSMGSKSAPITMEVFSDFECPSCRMLYEQTLRPLMSDYVANGKVYLVHHDFPLPMHKYSYEAARWADAAARIGHYAEIEQALFDNQATWSADGNMQKYVEGALSPTDYKRVAKLMEGCELSAAGVKPASASGQVGHGCSLDAAIEKDVLLGKAIPVEATPTFRFTYKGKPYGPTAGFVSWQVLKQFFDQLLTQ
jgi:protein-disulfide isomerase